MADLNPLIRVRKHVVEQKQKFLAELYRQAEELENQKKTLLDQLTEEREKSAEMDSAEMMGYFGRYADAVKDRVKDIDDAVAKLETRIDIARDDMRNAFAELKKIEITQDRREEEEQAEIDKKESDELDEIALEGYRRKVDEG
ncbi:MAG: hypothetical protein DHS20C02_01100 [Micavibrio sp.]|nr:MAG: hypothetical protein DHS20C02_01100 [Micavibrio sp.]